MPKSEDLLEALKPSTEMKFDARLLDKKVQQGLLTRQEKEAFLKSLPPETEYEFTSMEEIEKEEVPAV